MKIETDFLVIGSGIAGLSFALNASEIGRVTIKKRGSPIDPDYLNSRLRLQGPEHRYLFLTQVMGKAAVLIGQAV